MRDKLLPLYALLCAIIFGIGLGISGMLDPKNVIGFLDIFGDFNPALIFVMGFGILAAFPFFFFAKKLEKPLCAKNFHNPPQDIDKRLIYGAAIFGIGWALSGICPGPALVLLGIMPAKIILFVIAILIGGKIADRVTNNKKAA